MTDGRSAVLSIKPQQADQYAVTTTLPTSLQEGVYTVSVSNGFGGGYGWGPCADLLTVSKSGGVTWPTKIFNVDELGFEGAVKAAAANKGGVVRLGVGRYTFSSQLVLAPFTTIRGAGADRTSLSYVSTAPMPSGSMFTGMTYRVENLSVYAMGEVHNAFAAPAGSSDVHITNVRYRQNPFMKSYMGPSPLPNQHLKAKNVVTLMTERCSVTGCDFYAPNFALSMEGCTDAIVANNLFQFGGQGYSLNSNDRVIFENNTITGCTFTSVGNGMSTGSYRMNRKYALRLYYANNVHTSTYGNNREMMTLDGAGGAYYGGVASVKGDTVVLSGDLDPKPATMPANIKYDWAGAALAIVGGRGAGQFRRIVSNKDREVKLESPFIVEPDKSSLVSLTYFRGQMIFRGNTFEDGGATQLYGCAFDVIIAENVSRRTDGYANWGLNAHKTGMQPAYCNLFCDNQILEGNAYGQNAAIFWVTGFAPENECLSRLVTFRRNRIANNGFFKMTHAIDDIVVENNTIENSPIAIDTKGETLGKNVVIRGNKLVNVPTLINGPGAKKFTILP